MLLDDPCENVIQPKAVMIHRLRTTELVYTIYSQEQRYIIEYMPSCLLSL